jgi:hypothetical protein
MTWEMITLSFPHISSGNPLTGFIHGSPINAFGDDNPGFIINTTDLQNSGSSSC